MNKNIKKLKRGSIKDLQEYIQFKIKERGFEDETLHERTLLLVEEVGDKWLYWGNAFILQQTISDGETSGVYEIIKIYDPEFQRRMTIEESPSGKSYFNENPKSLLPEMALRIV